MSYSVCIATNGEIEKHKSLRLTIRAIKSQSLTPQQIVVAVNNPSAECIIKKLTNESPGVNFVCAKDFNNNTSYARNKAASHCESEFIAFLDDDTLIDGLDVAYRILSQSNVFDFSCGAKRLWAPSDWNCILSEVDPIGHIVNILKKTSIEPININRATNKQKLSNYAFIGNFGFVRRSSFLAVGGFDEEFQGWGYEDADLIQGMLHNNFRFLPMNNLGVSCYHLSHAVDKEKLPTNIALYERKIAKRGRRFHLNHLFGLFENDGWSLSSPA